MVLRQGRIGSNPDVIQYDDADYDTDAEFPRQITVGSAPTVATEVVRLTDLPTIGNMVIAAANITDHSIVRGDGGAKGIQGSLASIDDTGHILTPVIWHAYGGFEDQAETITCGVGDWNLITNAGNNLWNLDEADGITISNDVFTLVNSGDYAGNLSLSLSSLNGKDFHVRVYNNTQVRVEGRPIGISTTGAGNEMNVCVPIYIEGTVGDTFQFEIMSADGTDPAVDDGIFIISYLHT